MQIYTVLAGDTIYGISKQFGVSVDDIKKVNNLTDNAITIGQILKIPTEETTALYIVQKGDTLYSIAKKYNTTVSELISLNNLKSNVINPNQEIRIPIGETVSDQYINYTVQKGDSLYAISKKYEVTVNELIELNGLVSNALSIGQVIKIPVVTEDTVLYGYKDYTVVSGDSLYSIAKRHDMTVSELKEINNLNNNNLSIGQVLKVKQLEISDIPEGITECFGAGYIEPTYVTYTVKKGDSLYTIAKKYNTGVENLISLNDLKNNNLTIGQTLKIKEVT